MDGWMDGSLLLPWQFYVYISRRLSSSSSSSLFRKIQRESSLGATLGVLFPSRYQPRSQIDFILLKGIFESLKEFLVALLLGKLHFINIIFDLLPNNISYWMGMRTDGRRRFIFIFLVVTNNTLEITDWPASRPTDRPKGWVSDTVVVVTAVASFIICFLIFFHMISSTLLYCCCCCCCCRRCRHRTDSLFVAYLFTDNSLKMGEQHLAHSAFITIIIVIVSAFSFFLLLLLLLLLLFSVILFLLLLTD